jgi:hypothetical protein
VYIKYPSQEERDKAHILFNSKTLKKITLTNFSGPMQVNFPSTNVKAVVHTPGTLEKVISKASETLSSINRYMRSTYDSCKKWF